MEIRSAARFLEYRDSVRRRTRRVVACIPPDPIEWIHQPGRFTLGDLVRHLATIERYMYAETVAGRPSAYQGCGRELADGYEGVLAYFDRLDGESREIFAALSDEAFWLRAMVEHEVHHRGQLYLMLGMVHVPTPPLYGLTSEEVRGRSGAPSS